jgi:sugar O-acyltransferase (sialic acid O-acetyltransferase NeuD family)
MANVVVLGVGVFGRLARRYLEADSDDRVVAFTVHERFIGGPTCDDLPVVPFETLGESYPPDGVKLLVGAGYTRVNRNRSALFEEVEQAGYELATYVSSRSLIWPGTPVGEGSFIFEGVIVQPGVRIGRGVVVWSGTAINHDAAIGDFAFLASNVVVSGHVRLGHHTFAGANATFRDGVTTGSYSVVGAGAVITKDTADRSIHSVRGTSARGDSSLDLHDL